MDEEEHKILTALDLAVRSRAVEFQIDEIASRIERALLKSPRDVLTWEPIPLDLYVSPLPKTIRSSWVFVLRGDCASGPERHPNSHQRMMSYRGSGDIQTKTGRNWCSHFLKSDRALPLEERWISIPPNVWHQAVVTGENWVVISFYTATEWELVEERPATGAKCKVKQRKYVDDG